MTDERPPNRLLLVDDHAMVRRGMRDFLSLHDDLEVVAVAADGAAAIEQVACHRPDVVIMDLLMPGIDGIEATRRIKADYPVAGIVARRLRPAPAGGRAPGPGDRLASLTARERDVLRDVARGLCNRAIADDLGITERTARTHVSNILAKLGLASRTQAALLAAEFGLPER